MTRHPPEPPSPPGHERAGPLGDGRARPGPGPGRTDVRDRGAVATELAVALPALLLLVLLIVQFAVAEHARHVAQAVAAHAAAVARVQDGTAADGRSAGRQLLQQLGTTLTDATLDVRRDAQSVTVTVTGTAETVVPGVRLPVRATSTSPIERLVTNPRGAATAGPEGG